VFETTAKLEVDGNEEGFVKKPDACCQPSLVNRPPVGCDMPYVFHHFNCFEIDATEARLLGGFLSSRPLRC
jgi:hypothetical protein